MLSSGYRDWLGNSLGWDVTLEMKFRVGITLETGLVPARKGVSGHDLRETLIR